MSSTFMGLETSKRGLTTQQTALYTVGHNIANANTDGYSRQRVNMEATMGFPGVGMNAPKVPGYLGTGVQAGSITRIRDQFIDNQYRQETTKLGYWSSKSDAVSQMEDVLSEPSEYGLNKAFDNFYASLQDLSAKPDSAATRAVVAQRGEHLADSFNYISTQLTQIQTNLKNEISAESGKVNSIIEQIAALNQQIGNVEPNGYLPNDLYDARDSLLDQLSEYFNVTVDYTKSGGNSLDIAEGSMNVYIKLDDGSKVQVVNKDKGATLTANGYNPDVVDATTKEVKSYKHSAFDGSDNYSAFTDFTINMGGATSTISYDQFDNVGSGKMASLINSYGYATQTTDTWDTNGWKASVAGGKVLSDGLYPDKLGELNQLAQKFAEEFNKLHTAGFPLAEGTTGAAKIVNFFVDSDGNGTAGNNRITAANIKVNNKIISDNNLIAASTGQGEEGNGKQAILLSNLKTTTIAGLNNASAQTYYEGLIGDLGVQGQQATTMEYNSTTIQLTISNNRASVSSVSLDEEMTNMITFQQAYNASARMITVVDETLDKIINGMGRVGL
ncbi:flagellar hook-associated protein FlgK [Rummeliibacillus sp. TYF005]|uniref:flagellar hook-associated protein FlgK n=1 Tax=Rummeliibacillus sp. TYF005 TaxID=2058214 RepID=UPI000F534BF6|nr:flagellar hook-associated protein FlgK [Rummeliibacillus sp. TYF005]RPJ96816.1 flagellar hook-associated protein FlgK [Rummeliibacillus sp. TYF005]